MEKDVIRLSIAVGSEIPGVFFSAQAQYVHKWYTFVGKKRFYVTNSYINEFSTIESSWFLSYILYTSNNLSNS